MELETSVQPIATEPKIYRVPENNMGVLMERIKRLQNRAAKLQTEPIVVTEVGYEDFPAYRVAERGGYKTVYVPEGDKTMARLVQLEKAAFLGFYRRYHHLTVTGQTPKLAGWTFIGAIDVVRDEENKVVGNMLRVMEGHEMPVEYRTSKPHCDHCLVPRNWKSTYVVKHEDGTVKQVGRQCMRDFLGHQDPEHYLAMGEILLNYADLLDSAEDEGWEMGSGSLGRERWSLEYILTNVASIVSKDGWKPKAYQEASTAAMLYTVLNPPPAHRAEIEARYTVSDHDRQTAALTIEWMRSLADATPTSDYEQNLAVLAKAGVIEAKMFGLVASAIPAYLRSVERLAEIRQARQESNFIGEVKVRMEHVLTLAQYRYLDSDYGVRTMMRFKDDQGNVVIWWASGEKEMHIGTKIMAKFTVEKHDEFRGIKQTTVSRLKVLEVLTNPVEDTIAVVGN